MANAGFEKELRAALEAEGEKRGVDVVDVEVVGSSKAPVVRVRIDHADESLPTITLDEVAAETEWVSAILDEMDPIEGSFTLEVSSPGLDRPLSRPRDFERFAGSTVQLTTTATEGRRKYTGKLLGMVEGNVRVECDGVACDIPLDGVKKCAIKPEFDFSGSNKSKKKN